MGIKELTEFVSASWFNNVATDDFLLFNERLGIFYQNDKVIGIKLSNVNPALTADEIKLLLSYYAKDLKYLGIYGTIDGSVVKQFDFGNVTHLWLGSQTIKYLDDCLTHFPSLRNLYLDTDQLRTLKGIEKAEKLETVVLDYGRWNSFRPLKRLKKLKSLFIKFSQPDEKFLKEIPDVEELEVYGNFALSIPLEKLQSVEKLYLTYVEIDQSNFNQIAKWLSSLHNVVRLSVYLDNSVRLKQILDAISHLKNIEVLEISGNYDTVKSNPESDDLLGLRAFKKLRSLTLENILPDDLSPVGELENLEELVLWSVNGYNHFKSINDTFSHSFDFIAKLINLRELVLNTAADEIKNLDFLKNLQHLELLDISHSGIFDFSAIKYANNLKRLKLYNVTTKALDGIEKLQSLEKLDIEVSSIDDVSSLKALTNLKSLNIQFVDIDDFSFLGYIPELENLHIVDSCLENFEILNGLQKLKALVFDQSDFAFNVKNTQVLTELPNLRFLSLLSNKLNYYYQLPLNQFKQLWFLSIDQIGEIEQLTELTHIRELHIYTRVDDLSFLLNLQNIVSLTLVLNPQVDLTPLTKLQKLVNLTLSNVNVAQLEPIIQLEKLQNLTVYSLRGVSKNRLLMRRLNRKIPNFDYFIAKNTK